MLINKYYHDKGQSALMDYYKNGIHLAESKGSLYANIIHELKTEMTVSKGEPHQYLTVFLQMIDNPDNVFVHELENKKLLGILEQGTYDSICKKLILMAENNDFHYGRHQTTVLKLCDKNSDYFCSKFLEDFSKVSPKINSVLRNTDPEVALSIMKNWLVYYLSKAKSHPFPTVKNDKKAFKFANSKVSLKGIPHIRYGAQNIFAKICYPESDDFDVKILEVAFKQIGYPTGKGFEQHPEKNIKELIQQVLKAGDFIDSLVSKGGRNYNMNFELTHTSLYYWFDRYTNLESKFYDKTFTSMLEKDYPQQFSLDSLKYSGHRCHNRKKDEYIKALKTDPTLSYDKVRSFVKYNESDGASDYIRTPNGNFKSREEAQQTLGLSKWKVDDNLAPHNVKARAEGWTINAKRVDPVFFDICEGLREEKKKPKKTKSVMTPKGRFNSLGEARETLNIGSWALNTLFKKDPKNYYKIEEQDA